MISLPESKFNIVVFPQPDGPTIAVKVLGENFPEHGLRIFFFHSLFLILLFHYELILIHQQLLIYLKKYIKLGYFRQNAIYYLKITYLIINF